MSEEENKAIEYFENKLKEFEKRLGTKITTEDNINIEIILDLIDRLQKELEQEKLKTGYWEQRVNDLEKEKNVVHTDKIKDKIKFLDKNIELQWANTSYNEIEVGKYQYALEIIEDLLKENK